MLLRRTLAADERHRSCVMAAGVAMAEAVDEAAPASRPGLKWPNDLVVGDRKLAGILAEADGRRRGGRRRRATWTGERSPPSSPATATACNLEAGRLVDRDALLDAFLDRYADALDAG